MKRILVIAPHPDDETLGCGGTLLMHKNSGDELFWAIGAKLQDKEEKIVMSVVESYQFKEVRSLMLEPAYFDKESINLIIIKISELIHELNPEILYIPYNGDVHSDHRVIADASISCAKWFRSGSIKRILAYETISETEFSISPTSEAFRPNVFIDISRYLEEKINIMHYYANEIKEYPFPRSDVAIMSLARYRGSTSGCEAAEAFMLLREIVVNE